MAAALTETASYEALGAPIGARRMGIDQAKLAHVAEECPAPNRIFQAFVPATAKPVRQTGGMRTGRTSLTLRSLPSTGERARVAGSPAAYVLDSFVPHARGRARDAALSIRSRRR